MSARDRHPLAGQTVQLNDKATDPVRGAVVPGAIFRIEDYWQNVAGGSWMHAGSNPTALVYGMRSALAGLPLDNEVVYGKVDGLGHLVHVSELGEVVR